MKTPSVVVLVIGAHCVVGGALLLIQGCGSTRGGSAVRPPEPIMPPADEHVAPTRPAAGPSLRPTVVVPDRPAKSWPAQTTVYRVRKGDSLSAIASRYRLSMREIAAMNRLSNPDKLYEGQRLVLPGKVDISKVPPPKPRAAAGPPKTVTLPADGLQYKVKRGDSLSVIALRHGSTVKAIKQANKLSGDMIREGQTLVIPGGKPAAVALPEPVDEDPEIPALDLDAEPVGDTDTGAVDVGDTDEGLTLDTGDVAPPEPAAGSTAVRIHVAEADEDLYSVAMMWGVSVARLKEINGLTDTKLKVGQRLKIPLGD